ncbi:hypothetical protein R70006_04779 [Paraburkholderia domus]|uniref:hypothetical protein n=1 Tax=Paraburkholderia domus TaxID=2793075 RepID=UPI001912C6FB|nr:hypothetical protein [Paraburkholderia domus]MBK5051685.1 hypothetical protein [Burkholderia sp. R-70006]CAE6789531.1 hypothetical protein R70006_04779 [Paraburkholderia domus]CAE6793500.1 hypothetical protein R75483_05001 [Paraburkholderia domus]
MEIKLFKDLIDAVGAGGDAVGKIADGIKHAVVTGVGGYDAVKARRAVARLVDFSARVSLLHVACNDTAYSLREYSRHRRTRYAQDPAGAWTVVLQEIDLVLGHASELADDMGKERSDFVLEPAYAKLQDALAARQRLLGELCRMPPPASPEELRLVNELGDRYDALIRQLMRAGRELSAYIKCLKQ